MFLCCFDTYCAVVINDIVTEWMYWMAGSGSGRFQSDDHHGTPTTRDVKTQSRERSGMLSQAEEHANTELQCWIFFFSWFILPLPLMARLCRDL